MGSNGQSTAASLTDDIMVAGCFESAQSDTLPWNEEGLPSPILFCLPLLPCSHFSTSSSRLHHLPPLSPFITFVLFCPLLPSFLFAFLFSFVHPRSIAYHNIRHILYICINQPDKLIFCQFPEHKSTGFKIII